jgi:hypothetical protein
MPLFFEVVRFLKPRWVLMENVADMFKFNTGIYGRFSVSQLIEQRYQARVGFREKEGGGSGVRLNPLGLFYRGPYRVFSALSYPG